MVSDIRVGIYVGGSKECYVFLKNLPTELYKGLAKSGKIIAENIRDAAIINAPSSGRKGGIRDNIEVEHISRQYNRVYVKTPSGWGSSKSNVAKNIYPLAQEIGYRPHWIHINMIPVEVRDKYGVNPKYSDERYSKVRGYRGHTNWIFVRKFRPYMLPALLTETITDEKLLKKELTRAIDRLIKNTNAGRTGMFQGEMLARTGVIKLENAGLNR